MGALMMAISPSRIAMGVAANGRWMVIFWEVMHGAGWGLDRNGGDSCWRGSTAMGAAREILLARLIQMWQDARETMKTPCPKAHRPAETHLQTESPLSSASA